MPEFVRRTTAPETDSKYYYTDANPFHKYGFGLPNCTCYAFGRFWEIMGGDTAPSLSWSDAERWFKKTSDGYKRGTTPKLGAVICWARGDTSTDEDGAGHVAIVEAINADGSIVTSESGWGASSVWWEKTRSKGSDGNWGQSSKYTFQGFIYNPVDFEGVDASDVIAGNFYLSLDQMKVNARYIYQYLSARGWSLNAIAGMLGNFQVESTINPAIWESLDEGDTAQGYGLVQWTPATKFIDWCDEQMLDHTKMDSALKRIEYELANGLQYYPTDAYPETFAEFKTSKKSAYYLGMAFVTNYERPAEVTTARGENAEYWYDYLLEFASGSLTETFIPYEPKDKKLLPLWLLISATRKRS